MSQFCDAGEDYKKHVKELIIQRADFSTMSLLPIEVLLTSSPRDLLHVPLRSLRDLLHGSVLQCLVSSDMDNCFAASAESKYGQRSRFHARAWNTSPFPSHTSLVSFMITRSVRALEDQFAWSSRTSLTNLMSGARASS